MAYNKKLTARIESFITGWQRRRKKVFRGVALMINGEMSITVGDDAIMVRIDSEFRIK